jgi:hypothetical protein
VDFGTYVPPRILWLLPGLVPPLRHSTVIADMASVTDGRHSALGLNLLSRVLSCPAGRLISPGSQCGTEQP